MGVAEIIVYLIFKGIPASPRSRSAVKSLYPHEKSSSKDCSFFCADTPQLYLHSLQTSLWGKGGYKSQNYILNVIIAPLRETQRRGNI